MPKTTNTRAAAELSPPTGALSIAWSVDARRFAEVPAYRDRVLDFLLHHFPGRSPSPSDAAVIVDDNGQRVVSALCGIDAAGDLVTDQHGRRSHERAVAPYDEEVDLP